MEKHLTNALLGWPTFKNLFYIGVWFIYNVVLVSGEDLSLLYVYTYIQSFLDSFSI